MILINNLSVCYGKAKVLDNLCLSLENNSIHGIVGLNGSGKTTLLNSIFGLKKTNSGTIEYQGGKLNKKLMSYLVTENFFYSNITAIEYLGLFKNSSFNVQQWNRLFCLPLKEVIDGYSTGMKKKLALLGMLKQDKPILILDEPFNGLDLETCRILRMILLKLKEKGKTIIVTSHIIETLTNLCDHIHYLEEGKIAYSKVKGSFPEFERDLLRHIEDNNEKLIDELIP